MQCTNIYKAVERKIGGLFARYGRFVSHHAWKIIFASIIVNGALGIGMIKLQSDIELDEIYLPQGSRALQDRNRVKSIFPDLSGSNFNRLHVTGERDHWARVIIKSKTGNLLNRTVLEKIKTMSDMIQSITATADDGSTITFSDICAISNSQCAVDGDLFWDADFLTAVDNNVVAYPEFSSSTKGTYYALDIGGTLTFDNTGQYLTGLECLKLDYHMRTDDDQYEAMSDKWVDAFKTRLDYFSSSKFEVAYGHFNSLKQETENVVSSGFTFFPVAITLMITYASIATLSSRFTDQIGQRVWLSFTGILTAGLAVVSSFGFCSAVGTDFVNIVGAVPFLIIGIGIDDMFILLSGLSEAQKQSTVEDKMAETLRISGVGITITSLTDLIAFMAGAGSSFIAVRSFCIYTGVAVCFCYINNVTFFAACLVINERRVEENRHFMTCRRIKSKEELREEGKSKQYVVCCGGHAPKSRHEAESLVDRLPQWLIPKIVLKLPLKILIIFLSMGYFAAAKYGCVNLKQGLIFSQLVTDNSYFWTYLDWFDKYFKRQTAVSFVISSTYKIIQASLRKQWCRI